MGEARACDLRVRSFLRPGADFLVPDSIYSPAITCEAIKIHEGRQDKLNMRVERLNPTIPWRPHF